MSMELLCRKGEKSSIFRISSGMVYRTYLLKRKSFTLVWSGLVWFVVLQCAMGGGVPRHLSTRLGSYTLTRGGSWKHKKVMCGAY